MRAMFFVRRTLCVLYEHVYTDINAEAFEYATLVGPMSRVSAHLIAARSNVLIVEALPGNMIALK